MTAAGQTFDVWDLQTNPVLPLGYMKAHKSIVWFTGSSYPNPVGPYEDNLSSFLDGGGRLFMSGQDILDQGAGTTDFFHDYVHVDWDGSEAQNDKATDNVTGQAGNPVGGGFGVVPLDKSVLLGAEFSDQLTLDRPGHGRLQGRFGQERRADRRLRPVQGRLPRLPVRGVRDGEPEGGADDLDLQLLQRPLTTTTTRDN